MKTVFAMAGLLAFCVQGSVLSTTASQMQAGTWAEVAQTNIGPVMGGGAHAGNLSPYAMSGAWDSAGHRLHFLGGDHGCSGGLSSHVYFDETSNSWTLLGPVSGFGGCHEWDHIAIDQKNRRLYYSPYGGSIDVSRYNLASGGSWISMGKAPATGYVNITRGLDWFEGPLTGAGASGALVVYNCGAANGELLIYDPDKNQWIADLKGFGGTSTYHGFCEYSRTHNVAIFGGGNANGKKVWRLNGDRTISAMPDAPVDLGIQRANVVDDPVTGNFVVMGYGQLWEYNPSGAGQWTQQTGSRVPTTAVGNPGSPELKSIYSAAIPNYGVVMYVSCYAANCKMFLYKHAAQGNTAAEATRDGVGALDLTVSPNPVRGRVAISTVAQQVEVYNTLGRLVARLGEALTWDASRVPAGIYIVRASANGKALSRRIVVE